MELARDQQTNLFQIQNYHPGTITVNNQLFHQSLILSPQHCDLNWPPQSLAELTAEHLQYCLRATPALVIIGSGERYQSIAPALLKPFYDRKIGIEVMSSRSACQLYNVLMSENRNALVAILIR